MSVFLSLWVSRALSWALGPGLRAMLLVGAVLVALAWFSHAISAAAGARFEAAQAREVARVLRQEAARQRDLEAALEAARAQDAAASDNAAALEAELRSRIERLTLKAQAAGDCQLSSQLRKELNR